VGRTVGSDADWSGKGSLEGATDSLSLAVGRFVYCNDRLNNPSPNNPSPKS